MPTLTWPKHLALLLISALSVSAQTAPDTPVQQLRAALLGKSPITVAAPGLHAATKVLVHPIDNRVLNGVVQTRALMGVLRGSDDHLLRPGEPVRILAVETASDPKNDILRLTIANAAGAQAPVAFLLPAGTLASMSEAQLEQTVTPILTLPSSQAHSASPAGAVAPNARRAPVGWLIQQSPVGQEARITGQAEVGGKHIPAALVLSCTTKETKEEAWFSPLPAGSYLVQLRIRRPDLTYDISSLYEKDGDDNAFMHVQLGSSPELITDLSIYSSAPANARVASLVPGMDASELNQILKTPGSPLRIALASPDIPAASSITATFDLPADATPAQTAIDPCIQHAEAAAAALRDSRPVSCPARPGLVLVDGTVRNATTRKVLPVEPERDQGVGWLLPKPTKAHPIPPKLILQCDYAPPSSAPLSANTGGAVRKATESLNLPIPAAAAGDECETWIHVTESRSESYCAKPPRADPAR